MKYVIPALALSLSCGTAAQAQNSTADTARRINAERASTNANTKYFRNADNYPKPHQPPVQVRTRPASPYQHVPDVYVAPVQRRVQTDREYFEELRRKSANGDNNAKVMLADCYFSGMGTAKDLSEAYRFYRGAADRSPRAEAMAGSLLFNGEGTPANAPEAITMMKHAAAAGDEGAIKWVATVASWKTVEPAQSDWVLKGLNLAVEERDYKTMVSLSRDLLFGHFHLKDAPRAITYLRRAAQAGNAEAQMLLGEAYFEGNGVPLDLDEAQLWLLRADAAGNKFASQSLARIAYADTPSHPAEMPAFQRWAARSLLLNPQPGSFYLMGVVESQNGDDVKARIWFAREADTLDHVAYAPPGSRWDVGNVRADLQLGLMEWAGRGGPVDNASGRRHLETAAALAAKKPALGNREALYALGNAYLLGLHDLPVDLPQSFKLIEAAAQKDHAEAQYKLAYLLRDGKGTLPNPQESVLWMNKAAANGDKLAEAARGKAFNGRP